MTREEGEEFYEENLSALYDSFLMRLSKRGLLLMAGASAVYLLACLLSLIMVNFVGWLILGDGWSCWEITKQQFFSFWRYLLNLAIFLNLLWSVYDSWKYYDVRKTWRAFKGIHPSFASGLETAAHVVKPGYDSGYT